MLVDEVSMVDLFLFDALLAALPLGAHLVLLGDVDQLPSVGPGQVLADLIAAERAPVIQFTQIYRRAAGSSITASAHAVCAGMLPLLTDDPQAECRFIEAPDPHHAIARIVELVTDELPAATGCDPLTRYTSPLSAQSRRGRDGRPQPGVAAAAQSGGTAGSTWRSGNCASGTASS